MVVYVKINIYFCSAITSHDAPYQRGIIKNQQTQNRK